MKLGVLIKDGPYMHQAMDSAYNFITAALEMGQEVEVFLYNDGVYNTCNFMDPPRDERHIANLLAELQTKGVRMVVCVAAGKRRGIVTNTVCSAGEISGLGQLLELCITSDRLVTF